ncbi:MAG: SpoIIE family protein phosphatase [Cyanobacteria bacterium P01_C01_bin.89]
MFRILIIDDDPAIRLLLERTLRKRGYETLVAADGLAGFQKAQTEQPDLIICDWMMPHRDGIEVCRLVKKEPSLSSTFFILLTSLGSVDDRVKGLDAGADDFLSKPIEMTELQARVRAGLRLHQLNRDLNIQKRLLEDELAEAADYVTSLLPESLDKPVAVDSRFVPSRKLGGDCFDYFWLDSDRLVVYLVDAAGHGLKAALPSLSVLNLLRSQSIPNLDYGAPSQVLGALNQAFQMSDRNDKYFTVWYGVYHAKTRQLSYASAGHPPAILLSPAPQDSEVAPEKLRTPGLPIGMFPEATYVDQTYSVDKGSLLYVFSDGIYEINYGGKLWGLDAFTDTLQACSQQSLQQKQRRFMWGMEPNVDANHHELDNVLEAVREIQDAYYFEDDVSLIRLLFT